MTPHGTVPSHSHYRYDLVNIGREVLAQIATPVSVQFNATLWNSTSHEQPVPLDSAAIRSAAKAYVDVLVDLDELLNTDSAFQVTFFSSSLSFLTVNPYLIVDKMKC